MKVTLAFDLRADTPEEAQKLIEGLCEELGRKKLIGDYRFEIETTDGPVTEKCVLTDGKVIA
jgi:hypothetical protein